MPKLTTQKSLSAVGATSLLSGKIWQSGSRPTKLPLTGFQYWFSCKSCYRFLPPYVTPWEDLHLTSVHFHSTCTTPGFVIKHTHHGPTETELSNLQTDFKVTYVCVTHCSQTVNDQPDDNRTSYSCVAVTQFWVLFLCSNLIFLKL